MLLVDAPDYVRTFLAWIGEAAARRLRRHLMRRPLKPE